jgi:hypothetical protein
MSDDERGSGQRGAKSSLSHAQRHFIKDNYSTEWLERVRAKFNDPSRESLSIWKTKATEEILANPLFKYGSQLDMTKIPKQWRLVSTSLHNIVCKSPT